MQRERNFKVYLNNSSMRAALFSPVSKEQTDLIGHLAESAVFSQWQHAASFRQLRYSRWRHGEVDIVYLHGGREKPAWIGEVKWSDQYGKSPDKEIKNLRFLMEKHPTIESAFLTTKTLSDETEVNEHPLTVWPTALYCYTVGKNTTSDLSLALKLRIRARESDE